MTYLCLRTRAALGLAAVTILGLGGCGLISSDVTNFNLALSPKKFTIDAGMWNVMQSEADHFTTMSCASSPSVCSSAVAVACASGCRGTCNAAQKCDLSLDVALYKKIDLVSEKPELKSINDEPVIKVTIDSVTYEVTRNNLSVATPQINVYVGALSVLAPTDPSNPGTLIGTIPPIAAGTTTTSPQMLMFTPTGKAELVKIMSTFKSPFNVLVGSTLLVTAGQPVPTGQLDAVVNITGHAGL